MDRESFVIKKDGKYLVDSEVEVDVVTYTEDIYGAEIIETEYEAEDIRSTGEDLGIVGETIVPVSITIVEV